MKKCAVMVMVVLFLAVIFSIPVYAGCNEFEYAELMDMDKDLLIKEYCEVRAKTKMYAEASMFSGNRKAAADSDSCYNTMVKMDRVYIKKFKPENQEELKGLCK